MLRFGLIALLAFSVVLVSCEKCKRCSYTYTRTTIEQTVNGEQEVTTEYTGVLSGPDGETFSEECTKDEEGDPLTIEQWYASKGDTTVLDNYEYTCTSF